ncbi:hypothetical protein HPP92_009618 [Vanilla planifolia]|uniref:Acireductone dioxygenase n=1 Tax=Vanilla planifolia TaxID=51239 RepID=A0A835R6W2_VANPL|nr:hypothetical protein HPP92_009618 [Vanilla planifolia]
MEAGFGTMSPEAWLIDESEDDQKLPFRQNPKEFISPNKLAEIGILFWHLDAKKYDIEEELKKFQESKGLNYMDFLELSRGKGEDCEEKLKDFFQEHVHAEEEIRYCLEGGGYFDIRDKSDHWIRVWIKEGDMIVLPAGLHHRFSLDTSNHVKLIRFFVKEPVWTSTNCSHEPSRWSSFKARMDS